MINLKIEFSFLLICWILSAAEPHKRRKGRVMWIDKGLLRRRWFAVSLRVKWNKKWPPMFWILHLKSIWEETKQLFFSEKSDIVCAHHVLKAGVSLPRKVLLLCLLMPRRHSVEVFDEGIVHGKVWDGCGDSKWHKVCECSSEFHSMHFLGFIVITLMSMNLTGQRKQNKRYGRIPQIKAKWCKQVMPTW